MWHPGLCGELGPRQGVEAAQEGVKHGVCVPSAPGAMHVSPANDGCDSQTPIDNHKTAG